MSVNLVVVTVERLVQSIWAGALIAIGYIAVPVLFKSIDERKLAGEVAGNIFSVLNYVGLVAGVLLLVCGLVLAGKSWFKTRRAYALLLMLSVVLISLLVLQPMMQDLKSAGLVFGSEAARQFGQLHGLSSVLYVVLSLLGLYMASGSTSLKINIRATES